MNHYECFIVKNDRGQYLTELGTYTTARRLAHQFTTYGMALSAIVSGNERVVLLIIAEQEL